MLKVQCCRCWAIQETDGSWTPYPERLNEASHTYCPTHFAEEKQKLQVFKALRLAVSVA